MGQSRVGQKRGEGKSTRSRGISAAVVTAFLVAVCLAVSGAAPRVAAAAALSPLIHSSDNLGTKYGTWGAGYDCTTCHLKTQTSNIKKVPTTITTPTGPRPVVFTKMTVSSNALSGSFGNDERTANVDSSRNVCEVCHHQTIYHGYSASKLTSTTHTEHKSNRKDCTQCHNHRIGFKPPPAGDCSSCHGYPPTDPSQLITNALGPAPPADAGAHAKHRLVEGMKCGTCHNGYGHGLLGNDFIEVGFKIYSGNWPNFTGTVTTGTVTATNSGAFNNNFGVAPGNPGTTLLRDPAWGATCSIYCHGDGWNYDSGNNRVGPISWTNGPLGACSNATCHGTTPVNPPTPVVMGNVSTGAHKRHVSKQQLACTTCHDNYTTPHMVNGHVKWNLASQGGSATYKGFNIASTAYLATTGAYGSCNNIYCHSDVQSSNGAAGATSYQPAAWGGGVLSCSGCHASPMTAGSHAKHTTGYNDRFACGDCHSGAGKENVLKHADGNIDVAISATYGGSYSQAANPPANGFGSCSASYCHSDGNGVTTSATWGASLAADCTGCHGGNSTSAAPLATGKHAAHANNATVLGSNYGCIDCHATTVSGDAAVSSTARHVNMFKDYSGARAGKGSSYVTATGVCSATYCHTDGKGAQKSMTADNWKGATTLDCTGCHGSDSAPAFSSVAGEPNYANQGAGQPRANSHQHHMGGVGPTVCVYCHNSTMSAAGAIITASTTHTNRTIDVAAGGGKSFSYAPASKTCSTISCHGTGAAPAQWGQVMPADCTGCHGNNAASAVPQTSGKHAAHMNNESVLGVNYGCVNCHALTVSNDRTIADPAYHGNGFKNFTGINAGGRSSYVTATGVCSATYCHTDGKGTAKDMTVPNWKSAATLDCTGCHGSDAAPAFTSQAGEPNYASTGGGTPRANTHKNHIDFGAASCQNCHAATVAGSALNASGKHADRNIDVLAGNGKSFTFAAGAKTCSDISCHGSGSVPATWGATMPADCSGCHGNNATSALPLASGKHAPHINNAALLGSNYGCAECHAATLSADRTFNNPALHGNGFLDYTGARAGKGSTYVSATGVCSATYCHTDGKGAAKSMATDNWKGATTLDCRGCHGADAAPAFASIAGEPNYANQGAGLALANSHQKHVGSNGATTCAYCHNNTVTAAGTAILGGASTHTDRNIDVAQGGGKSFTWTAGTKSCASISCHGTGAPSAQWGQLLPADCSGCHGGNSTSAAPLTSGKHAAHVNNAPVIGSDYACTDCHAKTVSADRAILAPALHADGFKDYSGVKAGSSASYVPATGVCSATYCHSDGKGTAKSMTAAGWNSAATLGCTGCHGSDSAPDFTSQAGEPNYANAGGNQLRSNSHKAHAATGANTCVNCHSTTVTTAGTAIASGVATHTNRLIDVVQGGGNSFAWSALGKTCSNISCHNNGNATWGDASTVGCAVCHPSLSGAHGAHVSDLLSSGTASFYNYTANKSVGTVYRFGCANCHPTDTAKHRNGFVDITLNKNKTGGGSLVTLNNLVTSDSAGYTKGGPSNFTCELAYCHSSGKSLTQIAGDYRQTPNWYGGAVTGNKCGLCHDNPPQYTGQSHYVAASSLGNNGTPPYKDSGHMINIHFKNTSRGNNQNGFLGYSASGDKAHGNPAMTTTISCYICHSGIVSSTQVDTYAMNGTASKFRCGNCHTAGTPTPLQPGQIVDTSSHINGAKNVAFAPISFKTKAQLSNVANALGWSRNGGYKAAGAYDSFDLSVSTWNPGTKTCLTACHVNQPGITWGAALQCVSCHANQ